MGFLENSDVGIDLGTASVLVYVRGKGIVLREPSVVAVEKITGNILAVGEEARRMIGRTPGNIIAMRPLRDGVISNYDITERLLNHFLRKVVGRRIFFKPRVVVCVPSGVTEVEKRSVIDATEEAGARHTYLIEEPIAAAIGAGIDISAPRGSMILDIGGGALLYGMDKFIAEQTKVPCYVAEDPISCVAIGTGKVLENIDAFSSGAIYDYKRGEYFDFPTQQ